MKRSGITQLPVWMRFVLGAVYFLLMAQYVVNDMPWNQYFRLAALTCLGFSLVAALVESHRLKQNRKDSQNR